MAVFLEVRDSPLFEQWNSGIIGFLRKWLSSSIFHATPKGKFNMLCATPSFKTLWLYIWLRILPVYEKILYNACAIPQSFQSMSGRLNKKCVDIYHKGFEETYRNEQTILPLFLFFLFPWICFTIYQSPFFLGYSNGGSGLRSRS